MAAPVHSRHTPRPPHPEESQHPKLSTNKEYGTQMRTGLQARSGGGDRSKEAPLCACGGASHLATWRPRVTPSRLWTREHPGRAPSTWPRAT